MPSGLKYEIVNTIDTSKIQKLASKAAANIMVGFPSGRQHVPTLHKDANGEYKGYNGENVENVQPKDTADLARDLHFGTATIPARPFLEDGIRSKEKEIKNAIAQQVQKIKDGGQANWDKVGTMAVGAIKELVYSDFYKTRVPNSEETKEYKGSDKPLIDGADLINALVYIVDGNTDNMVSLNKKGEAQTWNMETYSKADFRS